MSAIDAGHDSPLACRRSNRSVADREALGSLIPKNTATSKFAALLGQPLALDDGDRRDDTRESKYKDRLEGKGRAMRRPHSLGLLSPSNFARQS